MTWQRFKGRRKFGNSVQPQACAFGFSHRSKLELAVCQLIALREKAGELKHVGHEVHITLCGPPGHPCDHKSRIEYVMDFLCELPDGTRLGIESKGYEDQKWPLKRRLWRHYGPHRLEEWGGTWRNPRLVEVIEGAA